MSYRHFLVQFLPSDLPEHEPLLNSMCRQRLSRLYTFKISGKKANAGDIDFVEYIIAGAACKGSTVFGRTSQQASQESILELTAKDASLQKLPSAPRRARRRFLSVEDRGAGMLGSSQGLQGLQGSPCCHAPMLPMLLPPRRSSPPINTRL